MNLGRLAFGAAMSAALTLGACESPAGKVSVLQADSVAIVPGSTYAWAPLSQQEMANGDPRIDNDIIRARLRSAIDSSLGAKGYRLAPDPSSAQLLVSYFVGLRAGTDVRVDSFGSTSYGCGWRGCIAGYGWGMYGAPTDIRTVHYTDGTVMVDLKDRSSGQLAWRATSQKRVDEGDGSQEKLDALVADLLKSLPSVAPSA